MFSRYSWMVSCSSRHLLCLEILGVLRGRGFLDLEAGLEADVDVEF